jgi:antitoxin HicB
MTPLTYFARLEPQGAQGLLVRFPDVPEAITQGEAIDEAARQAEDALAAALEGYLVAGRDFPARTDVTAAEPVIVVEVPIRPILVARWLLKQELCRQNLSQVALGRLMGRDEKTIRRIATGKGASLELMLKALAAVGVRPALAV